MPDVNLAYQTVFKLVGKQGQRVLEKKEFLDSVTKIDKDLAKTIEKSVDGVTNPTFELSGKATANYNIAGLKIRNGNQEIIGTGAVSKSQPDFLRASEIKGRFDLPNGEMIRIEGTPRKYEKSLNVYTGKDKNLKRVYSAMDGSYEKTVRTFDKEGDIKELRVFDAKENKIKTVYKYGDEVIEDMKVTNGKNGVTKLEMKWSKDSPCSQIIFLNKNGDMIAGSRYFNRGLEKVEKICDNGTDRYVKTTYLDDYYGNASSVEYEYFSLDNKKCKLTTKIDSETGKETCKRLVIDGVEQYRDFSNLGKAKSEQMIVLLENLSKFYDGYTTYFFKK